MAKSKRTTYGKVLAALVSLFLVVCIATPAADESAADSVAQPDQSLTVIFKPAADDNGDSDHEGTRTDEKDEEEAPTSDEKQAYSDEQNGGEAEPDASSPTIPTYTGAPSAKVNGNVPSFSSELVSRAQDGAFEEYFPMDFLGRATGAVACAGPETMPEGERGSIGHIKPPGFTFDRYDWVDGKYLYNRCHLIGWQLTGENDNVRNLVTGTRHMNVDGMLPYENMTASYIESTGNHVLYRAIPVYDGDDLVARGVLLEAMSVEDGGAGLCFSVFCFNVQPGVTITYATGASAADGTIETEDLVDETQFAYILNTNTKKIHEPDCSSVSDMKEKNKRGFNGTTDEAIAQGYSPCSRCNP